MFLTISCEQIDFDNTEFLMSYPLESEKIRTSVGAVGVVQPIIVSGCSCEGGYQIIAGFRRAYACRKLGIKSVNAHLYQMDTEHTSALFYLMLRENASHRIFNDVEKSLILSKCIQQFQCDRHEVIRDYMPLLGLAPNGKILNIYLTLNAFDAEIKDYIATHDLPLAVLKLLGGLSVDDRKAVFTLLSELKLGVNKLKELLTLLDEIALRDTCSIQQILKNERIREMLVHAAYSGPQKIEQIRRILREMRYPKFSVLEQTYQQQLKQLRVSSQIRLQTDRFFEDDRLAVGFRFQTPEQLRTIAEELLALSQKEELEDLLELIRGE